MARDMPRTKQKHPKQRVRIAPLATVSTEKPLAQIPPRKPIRPVGSLNEEVAVQFERLIQEGLPFNTACDFLGIQSATFWEWKRRGEKWLNGNFEPVEWEPYGQLLLRLRRAFATYLRAMNSRLHSPDPYWVQALHVLERRDRVNYRRSTPSGTGTQDYDPDERFI